MAMPLRSFFSLRMLRYAVEAAVAVIAYGMLRLLPLDTASAACGWLGRKIGPRMKAHRTALRNISEAMPHLTEAEKHSILTRMWNNIGRSLGEYPHLRGGALKTRYTIVGREYGRVAEAGGKAVICMSGHFGNVEMLPFIAAQSGMPLLIIYRAANNPLVDALLRWVRAPSSAGMKSKGIRGALGIVRAIKAGQSIGMLVDQKMNEGIAVPFFGREAMTAPAIAHFALKYGLPILPTRVFRTQGANFAMTVYPPFYVTASGTPGQDVYDTMVKINAMLEQWIRDDPAQWFWVHKRWGK